MFVELSVIPADESNGGAQISSALKVIDVSGLQYQLTTSGACIEGEWVEVMSVVETCHNQLREIGSRLITTVRLGRLPKDL